MQQCLKTYDLPNDSKSYWVYCRTQNFTIYATREVWKIFRIARGRRTEGGILPKPNLMRRLTFRDGGDLLVKISAGHSWPHREKLGVMYATRLNFRQTKKNTPKKERTDRQYRRELDQLILKGRGFLFIKKTFDINTTTETWTIWFYINIRTFKNFKTKSTNLPFEKRARQGEEIIDLEIAVQREDYETAAKLREELRDLNNITGISQRNQLIRSIE